MEQSTTYAAALADGDEDSLEQEPESVARHPESERFSLGEGRGHISIGGGTVGTIEAPDSIDEEFELYESTGFVSSAIHQYADDVMGPGVRATADSDETEEWLNDTFFPQAGVSGGQRHQEFDQFLYQDVIQFLAAGNILDENVKDGEGRITGFLHINPASCKALTEPHKPILRSPDAHKKEWWEGSEEGEWPMTPRDEAAAFAQYHDDSPLGRKGKYEDTEEVYLSLDDVTYRPRTPPAGEIWGIPIMRNIKEELTEFKNIRKDLARAIRTKAWGIWSVAFDTEVIETKDEVLVDGWSPEEMDAFTDGIGSMDPGEIVGHDGTISFEKHEGEVPEEVLEVLEAYVKLIVAALPPPLYAVGFEDNINQFVVKEQEDIYEASVRSMQSTLESTWTPTIKQVCRDHGKDPSGVQVEVEPPEDESPVRNMEIDDLEKFALLSDGLSNLIGEDAYRAFRPEAFADLIAQMPEDAFKSEAFVGVPGGVPDGVERLPILDAINEQGSVSRSRLETIQNRLRAAQNPDETPLSQFVSPFGEETGSGGGGIFGSGDPGDDDDDGNKRTPRRNPDGTLAGSS